MPIETNRSDFSPVDEGNGRDWHSVSHHKSSSVGIVASGQHFPDADITLSQNAV